MSGPSKPSLKAALGPVFAGRCDPSQVERRRRVLFGTEQEPASDVAGLVVDVLGDGVPRTVTEIAKEIKRRRDVVKETIHGDRRFVRVPAPPGRSTRARTWALAFQGEGQVGTSRFEVLA